MPGAGSRAYSKLDQLGGESRYDRVKREAREEAQTEDKVYAAVTLRDDHRCRVCGAWCNPQAVSLLLRAHHHHIVYRSAGGETTVENVCLLCADCHNDEHKHVIRLTGNAEYRDPCTRKLCGICIEKPKESGWQVVAWV